MAGSITLQDEDRQRLREVAGTWLKKQREDAGLTQRELSKALDLKVYTFISQIELGRGRIPPDKYRDWAKALKMDPYEFVSKVLYYYEPTTYYIVINEKPEDAS